MKIFFSVAICSVFNPLPLSTPATQATLFSVGKCGGHKHCREFFVIYCPLHTAECATGLSLFDWLYTLWHGIKDNTLDGQVIPPTS